MPGQFPRVGSLRLQSGPERRRPLFIDLRSLSAGTRECWYRRRECWPPASRGGIVAAVRELIAARPSAPSPPAPLTYRFSSKLLSSSASSREDAPRLPGFPRSRTPPSGEPRLGTPRTDASPKVNLGASCGVRDDPRDRCHWQRLFNLPHLCRSSGDFAFFFSSPFGRRRIR